MRVMLANLLPWIHMRRTYGQAIESRELVKRRIARLAGLIVGADALVAWGSWLIDQGYRGELECIIAKIFGSEAQKEAAIELFMKTHGGRSFLKGHLFGDNVYDFLAPCIYEGEGEMLGMAFFKSLVKQHVQSYFEPIGKALQKAKMPTFSVGNPLHVWRLRRELGSYGRWWLGKTFTKRDRQSVPDMDARLAVNVDFALKMFQRHRTEFSAAFRKHQLKLADRQCRMAELSLRVQDSVVMLVTALHAHRKGDAVTVAAADLLCQDLQRKLTGKRPTDRYFRTAGELADRVIGGEFPGLSEVPKRDIMQRY
jgi:hypothetical protein